MIKPKPTPCGYPAGPITASDGTVYEVLRSGQIVRRERKMTKAELKRHRRARRRAVILPDPPLEKGGEL